MNVGYLVEETRKKTTPTSEGHGYAIPSCVPLPHNVVQGVHRFTLKHSLCFVRIIFVYSFLHSFHKLLEISKFLQQRLVGQELNIFVVVEGPVGCAALVHLLVVIRFMWVDAFQNTQPSVRSGIHHEYYCEVGMDASRYLKSGKESCSFFRAWLREM